MDKLLRSLRLLVVVLKCHYTVRVRRRDWTDYGSGPTGPTEVFESSWRFRRANRDGPGWESAGLPRQEKTQAAPRGQIGPGQRSLSRRHGRRRHARVAAMAAISCDGRA